MQEIKSRLILIILIMINLTVAHPFYYSFDFTYDNGAITMNRTEVIFLDTAVEYHGGFVLRLFDNDQVLEEITFDFPLESLFDEIDDENRIIDGGLLILNQTSQEIFVPYHKEADRVVVYNNKKEIVAEKDLSAFLQEDDQKVDESKERDPLERTSKTGSSILIIVVIVGVVLLLLLFTYRHLKKRNKNGK